MSKVPIHNVTPETAEARPVHVSEEVTPVTDQRQARIDAITSELADRQRIINIINKFGGFDPFVASTLKLEGVKNGLLESITLAPPVAAQT